MVVPIIASISRDLFLSVPRELQEGATALGATRWEVLRGVVLPYRPQESPPPRSSAWAVRSARRSPSRR